MDNTNNLSTKDFDKAISTEHSKKDALIKALIEGEESGFVKGFDRKENLDRLHKTYLFLNRSK